MKAAVVLAAAALALAAPAAAQAQETASIVLGESNEEQGLVQTEQPDGRTTPVTIAGRSARSAAPGDDPSWGRYIYFGLDDDIAFDGFYVARIEVEYLDEGTGAFALQYDSNDCTATLEGAYTPGGDVARTGTGTWKTATFDLANARFANRQNGGSDFRLHAGGDGRLTVHRVTLTIVEDRTPPPVEPEPGVPEPVERVSLERTPERLALDNGYVRAEFDLERPQIDVLTADFGGRKRYAADLTGAGGPLGQSGIVLEREGADGAHASSQGAGPDLDVDVLRRSSKEVVVRVDGIVDDADQPLVSSSWTLSLAAGERTVSLRTSTRALRSAADVRGVRIAHYLSPSVVYGLFDRGVVQMTGSPDPHFASDSRLERVYAIGGGAVDVSASGGRQTVLHSRAAACGNAPSDGGYRTGFEQVLAGRYPSSDRWDDAGWAAASPAAVSRGQRWDTQATIAANGHDFPAGRELARPAPNLPERDLRAMHTAIYGTAVGVLDTYALPGEAAPTLAAPGRTYGSGRNFYDPDAWLTVRALLYAGEPYLREQARALIEKTGEAIRPDGQIPHHFEGPTPTYVAISGATQTGPNIFWILAALDYARNTGDHAWLRAQMPRIERALAFVIDRYDPAVQLISAPGPLWIDVFIRENFATDTNAFAVELLRQVADAEAFLGDHALAAQRRAMAQDIVEGMNERLWADDHYITQLNPDGTTRDLVDYDANLLAVAFGIASPERAQRLLARVDAGPCTHGRATWVSERYYGPADTYNGNTGDSATAMGRIGWADALARARVGDRATYEDRILGPLREDLLERTWLTERYDCAGSPIRAPYYHEYPELVAMLLREITYGIELGLDRVTIDPLARPEFRYRVGDVDVDYSPRALDLELPGGGERAFEVHGMTPGAEYLVVSRGSRTRRVRADDQGTLRFTAGLQVRVRRLG